MFHGVVKCSTNLNSDPVDMYTDCLKLGISTGLYGLTLTNLLNDVLLGEPELRMAPVGLRVVDPDYINIMITGHQHTIFVDLQERLKSDEAVAEGESGGSERLQAGRMYLRRPGSAAPRRSLYRSVRGTCGK